MADRSDRPETGGILPLTVEALCFEGGGNRLIKDVSFSLEPAGRTVILGPNGAGKSLLLRLCHGLIAPTSGRVVWHGANGHDPARRQAMVFQRPVMLRRTARANVEYALAGRNGRSRRARRERADEVLERVGLSAIAAQPARTLSVGEQQRLALARAWALDPEVLFLDEPTASLDPGATQAIEDVIRAIAATDTKVVWTTHDLAQARRLADEVLFLDRGRLVERAAADAFFSAPGSAAAQAFLDGRLSW